MPAVCFASQPSPGVAIIVSSKIKPYLETSAALIDGLKKQAQVTISQYHLEAGAKTNNKLADQLLAANDQLLISIGPKAADFIYGPKLAASTALKLYTMLLNPSQTLPADALPESCGISMNIPIGKQLEVISKTFPDAKSIGLVFDPAFNGDFFERAQIGATGFGLEIKAMKVDSKTMIPSILTKNWKHIDFIWMIPDRTVISEAIVTYVIKQAILNRTPVIGYNRFFYEAGAAVAFVFDYRQLGRQTADEALHILEGKECRGEAPLFSVWLNIKVLKALDWAVAEPYDPSVILGP
jgi:putative ABC transport system substrate-binding protein